jgi:hypothetical protein
MDAGGGRMELHDPVVAFIALNNIEAHFVCGALTDAGIAAAVVEDISVVGGWIGAMASQLHKPQVCIGRADAARAAPILQDYERRLAARLAADASAAKRGSGETIEVTCEDCGKRSAFPAAQRGSVQICPKCGGYVDIVDDDEAGVEASQLADADEDDDEAI